MVVIFAEENSFGEIRIQDLLSKNKIRYVSEKTFSDLRGLGGGKLLYDFLFTRL